jgi:thiol-disulfide isomerase/thioredoxin
MKLVLKIIPLLLLTALFGFAEPSIRLDLPPQLQKETLPPFVAKDRNADNLFNLSHLKKLVEPETERVALVYFATWCKPCIEGMIKLRKDKEKLKKNNIQIVLINVGESDATLVHSWIKKYSDEDWSLIMDTRQQMIKPFGLLKSGEQLIALPQTIILDKKLKAMGRLGTEGDDWPQLLWREEDFNP